MTTIAQRATKAASSIAGQHDFPVLFTVEGSGRHEIILVNPGNDLEELKQKIAAISAVSPNCAEVLQKYRSKSVTEKVSDVKVRWSMESRDARLFPRETVLTDDNVEPVLRMMAIGVGNDVIDVKITQETKAADTPAKGGAKK